MSATRYTFFFITVVITFGLILFFSTPFFNVKEIIVTGNHRLTTEYIKEKCGIKVNDNIFAVSHSNSRKKLLENKYISDVVFEKQYPNKLVINISERKLSGYIEYMKGSFLYIDDDGRVLEVQSFFTENLPVIIGLEFTEFTIGEVLNVKNQSSFDTIVTFSKLFSKYNIENQVIRIDVRDSTNIKLFVYNIDILFGGIADADEKIRTMSVAIENLPNYKELHGTLDIRDIKKPPIFKILT